MRIQAFIRPELSFELVTVSSKVGDVSAGNNLLNTKPFISSFRLFRP